MITGLGYGFGAVLGKKDIGTKGALTGAGVGGLFFLLLAPGVTFDCMGYDFTTRTIYLIDILLVTVVPLAPILLAYIVHRSR